MPRRKGLVLLAVTLLAISFLFIGARVSEQKARVREQRERASRLKAEAALRAAPVRARVQPWERAAAPVRAKVQAWNTLLISGQQWAVQNVMPLQAPNLQIEACHSLAFSPDGKILASGTASFLYGYVDNHKVLLWDARSGRLLRTLRGHRNKISRLGFSPDGRTLGSAEVYQNWATVKLWDVRTGDLKWEFGSNTLPITDFWSPNAIAKGDPSLVHGKGARRLRERQAQERRAWRSIDRYRKLTTSRDDRKPTTSPNGRLRASREYTQDFDTRWFKVTLRDARTGKLRHTLRSVPELPHVYLRSGKMLFSADSKLLAHAHNGGTIGPNSSVVDLWDVRSGKLLHAVPVSFYAVLAMAFSTDGKRLAVGGNSSGGNTPRIEIWQLQ